MEPIYTTKYSKNFRVEDRKTVVGVCLPPRMMHPRGVLLLTGNFEIPVDDVAPFLPAKEEFVMGGPCTYPCVCDGNRYYLNPYHIVAQSEDGTLYLSVGKVLVRAVPSPI